MITQPFEKSKNLKFEINNLTSTYVKIFTLLSDERTCTGLQNIVCNLMRMDMHTAG